MAQLKNTSSDHIISCLLSHYAQILREKVGCTFQVLHFAQWRMLFTISSFFLITASLHWVSCDNDLEVGTTKNCSDITKGQATFPVRYGNKDGCCVKEAKKLFENEDFTYPKRQLCCLPPGNKCRKGSTPCCNQLT